MAGGESNEELNNPTQSANPSKLGAALCGMHHSFLPHENERQHDVKLKEALGTASLWLGSGQCCFL